MTKGHIMSIKTPAGTYLVHATTARSTGVTVAVLNLSAPGALIEKGPEGEAWFTQCVEHGWGVWTENRRAAHLEASSPEEFCDECADMSPVDVTLEFEVSA